MVRPYPACCKPPGPALRTASGSGRLHCACDGGRVGVCSGPRRGTTQQRSPAAPPLAALKDPACPPCTLQTRGNQREIDRARAQKRKEKAGVASKDKPDGLTPLQRRERDAKALQEKAAKKAEGGKK
jgi:hypothetical protein